MARGGGVVTARNPKLTRDIVVRHLWHHPQYFNTQAGQASDTVLVACSCAIVAVNVAFILVALKDIIEAHHLDTCVALSQRRVPLASLHGRLPAPVVAR